MRVLFCCTPGEGHYQPLLPLARAAASRGYAVAFATGADRATRAAADGFDALDAGIPLPEAAQRFAPLQQALQIESVPFEERRLVVYGVRFGKVDAPAKLGDLRAHIRDWRPDIVVFESSDLSAPIAAAEAGVPAVHHGFGRTIPAIAVRRAAEIVAPLWRDCGLEPDEWAGLYRGPYVDICPRSLQSELAPEGADVQPLRPTAPAGTGSSPPRPFVYATLGTVFNTPDRFRDLLTAFDGLDCDVLLTVGRNVDPAALAPVPGNVRVEQFVPQADVLPDATAVVAHAGSGSTWGALAHGCPLVLVPTAADQFDNALACARSGAAVTLLPGDQTAEKIRDAVLTVLREPSYAAAARRIADEIGAMPSADDVAARLEAWARTSVD